MFIGFDPQLVTGIGKKYSIPPCAVGWNDFVVVDILKNVQKSTNFAAFPRGKAFFQKNNREYSQAL